MYTAIQHQNLLTLKYIKLFLMTFPKGEKIEKKIFVNHLNWSYRETAKISKNCFRSWYLEIESWNSENLMGLKFNEESQFWDNK